MKNIKTIALLTIACSSYFTGSSQVSLSAQLRTRAEFRDGQGAPLPKGSDPAFFITQRTRLGLGFNSARLKTNIALQDVRVWGQDVSTINRNTVQDFNGLMLHEAWAEIILSDTASVGKNLSLKIGRQELIYDDQRLIGNLDWLQQARRHDAAVLKFQQGTWTAHVGAAFNQNKESQSGTIYSNAVPGGYPATTNGGLMYKSMQFLYAARKNKSSTLSFLFFSDQFSRYFVETVDNVPFKNFLPGSWARFTSGLYYSGEFERISIGGSAYYQFGKTNAGEDVKAFMLTGATHYRFGRLTAGAGLDYTSGGTSSGTVNTFDPLYGTPHKFWGAMDYFYAGSGFGKNGLADFYLRVKHNPSTRLTFTADLHHFESAAIITNTGETGKRKLGDELDLHAAYSLSRDISLEGGFSHFFSTTLLTSPAVKNVVNVKSGANWAYVMVNIKPQFIFK